MDRYLRCLFTVIISVIVILLATSFSDSEPTLKSFPGVAAVVFYLWQFASGLVTSKDRLPLSLWYIPTLLIGGIVGILTSSMLITIVHSVSPPPGIEFVKAFLSGLLVIVFPGVVGYVAGNLWRFVLSPIWRVSVPATES